MIGPGQGARGYLETDAPLDVLISLREVCHQLPRTSDDVHCWKWCILALWSAVSGAHVCNVTGTMQIGALDKDSRAARIQGLQHDASDTERSAAFKKDRLASGKKLLALVEAPREQRDPNADPPVIMTPQQRVSFSTLQSLRDQFVHFKPVGWMIDLRGLPEICRDMLLHVAEIANGPRFFLHMSEAHRNEFWHLHRQAITYLDDAQLQSKRPAP